jgi:hypothetical protein
MVFTLCRAELSEARARVVPAPAPPTPSLPLPEPTTACVQCHELNRQLGVAVDALNNRSYAKYGDLLHSNFTLQQKVHGHWLCILVEQPLNKVGELPYVDNTSSGKLVLQIRTLSLDPNMSTYRST